MGLPGASESIHAAVTQWSGIEARPHQFGGTEYLVGPREVGHTHGDSVVDIPFPRAVRDELVADGSVAPHHTLPESGWVSFYLSEPGDEERAIALLQRSYGCVRERAARREQKAAALRQSASEGHVDFGGEANDD